MKYNLLLWGFQDLNFVSDIAKKARYTLQIQEFYIQIPDSEKTLALIDLYPEEIIRTKFDLSYLHQWLLRTPKKNICVLIDVFNMLHQEHFEENCESLKQLLTLEWKFCFFAPKILNPQGLKFITDPELKSIDQKTNSYSKKLKKIYEIVLNSKSKSNIIASSVLDNIYINGRVFNLFQPLKNFLFDAQLKLLNNYDYAFNSQSILITKLIQTLGDVLYDEAKNGNNLILNINAENHIYNSKQINYFKKLFKPTYKYSLEKFYNFKSNSIEGQFILWILYLSICDQQVFSEVETNLPLLSNYYFLNVL